uniref:Thyroglobulin type-1 domain-containing protein n=1 Tax=Clytia hemisphaerica TaxID=252671 RepID=A0A7M5XKY5_9CNID
MRTSIFVFCLLFGVIFAKSCLDEVKELEAKPPMVGAYKPICQTNGLYAETQYHASYYFCVNPKTGEKILGTDVRFRKPSSCKTTPCMLQRHQGMLNSKQGMVGHFTPQCEEDGSFKKVQCHGSTGYCFCVAADTGVKVEGTEVRGKPTNCETAGIDNADKPCLKQLNELQAKQPLLGQFKPKCQANGMFAEMQSHAGYHYCVFPKTGEEIKGTRIRFAQPKTCKATPCLIQRHHAMKDSDRGMVGQFTPQCETDGSFTVTQCHSSTGFCFCVVPETGEKLLGTELRFKKPKNCEMTECMHERHQALKSGLLGVFKPACDEDGLYSNVQCAEGICYCVFAKTGAKVLGTELERGVRPTTCELTKCFKKRHEFLSQTQPLLGARKPVCTADGNFNAVQCHEGVCHCVFPTTGEEVLGTMTRFRKPQSCKLTQCVLARHKGWKMASYGLLGVRIPRCAPSGDYQKVQCRNGMCWCVNPTTGKAVAGKSAQWTVPSC